LVSRSSTARVAFLGQKHSEPGVLNALACAWRPRPPLLTRIGIASLCAQRKERKKEREDERWWRKKLGSGQRRRGQATRAVNRRRRSGACGRGSVISSQTHLLQHVAEVRLGALQRHAAHRRRNLDHVLKVHAQVHALGLGHCAVGRAERRGEARGWRSPRHMAAFGNPVSARRNEPRPASSFFTMTEYLGISPWTNVRECCAMHIRGVVGKR